jgi:hypothetical protein
MTPKQHAEYFLAKFNFIPVNNGYSYKDTLEIRKKCALILTDEIIAAYAYIRTRDELSDDIIDDRQTYIIEVEDLIKAL